MQQYIYIYTYTYTIQHVQYVIKEVEPKSLHTAEVNMHNFSSKLVRSTGLEYC